MTAQALLEALREAGCEPTTHGQRLVLGKAPPDALAPLVPILQTGLRAILTRRRWYYTAVPGLHRAGGELDPSQLLPHTAHLLTVEGDRGDAAWDRVDPLWKIDHPDLFASKAKRKCP